MMKLSFITDEVTQSFEEAVLFAKQNGLQGVELRSVENMAFDAVPISTLQAWRERLDTEGLTAVCIAGSFYKCEPEEAAIDAELEKLVHLCDAADVMGCKYIRGFALFAPPTGEMQAEQLVPYFAKPAQILKSRGKKLLLEADPSVNTTNHAALARLLANLDAESFGAIYDPGNDLFDKHGETPYPDGYEAIKPYFAHVHIKDAVPQADAEPLCVAPGQGLVGYDRLIKRLISDGYNGWLSLEPHYRKNAVLTAEQMRLPQGEAFSHGGAQAAAESAKALQAMLLNAQKECRK